MKKLKPKFIRCSRLSDFRAFRPFLTLALLLLTFVSARAQKWQPGFFIDRRGQKVEGLIRTNPSGKAPVKNEGFIVYKENEKGTETRFSASDIRCFVAGQDSFVVAHAPNNETWSKQELDFVKVVLDEEVKLYMLGGAGSSGGSGLGFHPGVAIGGGGGGMMGGGMGISFGGGGGGSGNRNVKATYYYGSNTANMHQLTVENFNDAMMDIMGDEPQAMEAIRSGKFTVGNVNSLIAYFKQLKARH